MRTRRRQGEGESPTLPARSARLMRPSSCSRPRILRSTASRACGMKTNPLATILAEYAKISRDCDPNWRPLPSRQCEGAAMANARKPTPSASHDLALLAALERKVLWLASWTIHHANHLRESTDGLKVGGHQASSASLATIMTALYFATLRPEDRVAVKPHASPNFHAIQYLLGRQTRDKLQQFRGFGGAQSYPSRTKDGRDVAFSTGSVGLGAAVTIFASMVQDYVHAHGLASDDRLGRMIALVGDAELDEGNIYEALLEGWKYGLPNTWWVIHYNRQSLDAVVPEDLPTRFEQLFARWAGTS